MARRSCLRWRFNFDAFLDWLWHLFGLTLKSALWVDFDTSLVSLMTPLASRQISSRPSGVRYSRSPLIERNESTNGAKISSILHVLRWRWTSSDIFYLDTLRVLPFFGYQQPWSHAHLSPDQKPQKWKQNRIKTPHTAVPINRTEPNQYFNYSAVPKNSIERTERDF